MVRQIVVDKRACEAVSLAGACDAFVALPSEHLQIDVSMDAPAEAARAEVVLEDGDGRRLGVLDAVTL